MLDYRTYGRRTRPALTLLHAGGMTYREWQPFIDRLSRDFFCIAPTALGHGASPAVERLSFEEMAASVAELLEMLRVPRTHLLGSSMGATTAVALARRHRDRVDRMVLYRGGYRTEPAMRGTLEAMVEPETWRRWGLEHTMREQHRPQGGDDAWIEVARRVIDLIDPEHPVQKYPLCVFEEIARPTLIICGDRDPLVPLEDAVAMYRALPAGALWVVPRGTHLLGAEGWRRSVFETEVIRFLTRDV